MGEIVTRQQLIAKTADARADGRTIAFANGCFDLLHVGHIRYLESAAQEADVLVVAVNDDASVATLKGRGQPIMAEGDRAELVAALRCVDYVVLFPEPTVGPLLEALHPDVHCKGTDYTCRIRARTCDRRGLRRPHGHRGRSEGSLDARSACAHQGGP